MLHYTFQVKLVVEGDNSIPSCSPSFDYIRETLKSTFDYVIESAKGLPRIETYIFSDLKEDLQLHSVNIEEEWVQQLIEDFGKPIITSYLVTSSLRNTFS